MNSNFKNNTIIILRPKDRAKCLERLLLLNGYTVIVEPVINIYPQKYSPVNFDNTEAIMLSSVNSVKILKNTVFFSESVVAPKVWARSVRSACCASCACCRALISSASLAWRGGSEVQISY